MKRLLLIVTGLLMLSSCSNDDDAPSQNQSALVGEWKLVARYADPGDGSGDFETLTSLKTIVFEADGSLSSNADLCLVFSDTGEPSTGTYSITENSITMDDCPTYSLGFELNTSNLILNYPCIEGCKEKYEKIE